MLFGQGTWKSIFSCALRVEVHFAHSQASNTGNVKQPNFVDANTRKYTKALSTPKMKDGLQYHMKSTNSEKAWASSEDFQKNKVRTECMVLF